MAQKATEKEIGFNILFYKEDGCIVGHCLELDIVAAGDKFEDVKKEIIGLICAQLDYAFSQDNLNHLYRPAPPEVWQKFFACQHQHSEVHEIHSILSAPRKKLLPSHINAHTCLDSQFGVDCQLCHD